MRKAFHILFICWILILASCSSSKIVSAWGTDAYSPQHRKIVVFAVMNTADSILRQRMEQHVIGDLEALGYHAFSSAAIYGQRLSGLSTTQAYQQLHADSVDAVMTIVLLDKRNEQVYVEAKLQQIRKADDFLKYYEDVDKRIAPVGSYTNLTIYFWEGKLYDLKAKELVYTSRTESINPSSIPLLGHEYGKQIVKNMVKKGVLIKRNVNTARPI